MRFENKVALVTGAGSGIGRTTAQLLAADGASVVVVDLVESAAQETVEAIEAAGGRATAFRADVSTVEDTEAMVAHAVSTYGQLDLAHNNAGIVHRPAPLHELPVEDFDRVIAIDLRGVFLSLRAELAHMVPRGTGAIVNTASAAGLKAARGLPAYVAAKHGVVGLTRNAAIECAPLGIRVNAVAPGAIETPLSLEQPAEVREYYARIMPSGRVGTTSEVAELVAFLLSDVASYISGDVIEVDGAFMQASPE